VEKLQEEIAKDSQHLRHLISICEGKYQVLSKKEEMNSVNHFNNLSNDCRPKTGWGDCTK